MLVRHGAGALAVGLVTIGCAASHPRRATIDASKVVDLSYAFGPDTIYWPTAESFTLTPVAYGHTRMADCSGRTVNIR